MKKQWQCPTLVEINAETTLGMKITAINEVTTGGGAPMSGPS
ncbi:MAG: hypothetical protein P1U63_08235 [Coxiellaceae bacterium]|nr:hypothetical protein [Coxiellaceae bacterium]